MGPLILNLQAVANPTGKDPTAMQCVMYWAVATFDNTNVTNFSLDEEPAKIWTNTSTVAKTSHLQNNTIYLTPPECWGNGTRIDNTQDARCQYTIHPLAQLGLQNYLTGKLGLQGFVSQVTIPDSNPPLILPEFDTLFAKAITFSLTNAPANETYKILEQTVKMITVMLSQGVRQIPGKGNFPAKATAFITETFYDIHFLFLGMTHLVVGGTVMFFVWSTAQPQWGGRQYLSLVKQHESGCGEMR